MESPEHQKRDIRQYFESQVDDEEITHLEKIASERILGRKHDVWDLHTDKERWWIITDATNLYRQRDFPSMDYAISFHIGLMVRIVTRQRASVTEEEQTRFSVAWRRFEQSHQALDKAEEAEDFQAVGMRCRECLIAFVREAGTDDMVPDDQMRPKRSDFIHWSELIAQKVAAGDSNERLRNYLKTTAKVTWEYVQTLTHASNAARFDGEIAIDATGHVLSAYSHALLRQEQHPPNRCPDFHPTDSFESMCSRSIHTLLFARYVGGKTNQIQSHQRTNRLLPPSRERLPGARVSSDPERGSATHYLTNSAPTDGGRDGSRLGVPDNGPRA